MKQILLGAFEIDGVNLTTQGLWAHPEQQTYRYKDLDYWMDLAKLLDRGGFDFLFFADSYGYPVVGGETPPVVFEQAVEIPKNDPMILISALAAVTEQLSFVVTASTTFEHPFSNARRFATLDHATKGRLGWNVVTTSNQQVSKLFGTQQIEHDQRYLVGEEFLQLSYALLEGSWEDDAVLVDKANRIYADAAKIHPVEHRGTFFTSSGYFNCEPSPQRTPVLVQAGASKTGMSFAARNAEIIFLHAKDADGLRSQVASLRDAAEQAGRARDEVKGIAGLTVVVGETEREAQAKLDEYLSYTNPEAVRAYYASMTGIDLNALDPNASMKGVVASGTQTHVDRYKNDRVEDAIRDFTRKGMREVIITGTPAQAAEQIAELVEHTDLDGFNYTPFTSPRSYEEFVELVVPELRSLGLVPQRPAAKGTAFREHLRGTGNPRLPQTHPAAAHRIASN